MLERDIVTMYFLSVDCNKYDRKLAPVDVSVECMFVRVVVVGACIQGYWNGPMGFLHGGAVMLAVGGIQVICLSNFVHLGNITNADQANSSLLPEYMW